MMAINQNLDELQQWYLSNCDGDWEHTYGIEIGTLDNPGWRLEIDLAETVLETCSFEPREIDHTPNNWYHCKVESNVFKALGGPGNLPDMIQSFIEWWHVHRESSLERDNRLPVS